MAFASRLAARPVLQAASRVGFRPCRFNSTSATPTAAMPTATPKRRRRLITTLPGLVLLLSPLACYLTDTRASVHALAPAAIRGLVPDAETAHHLTIALLKTLYSWGLHPRERTTGSAELNLGVEIPFPGLERQSFTLASPVGISAGLDKNAAVPDALFELGASVVEVGGVTPLAQAGNPTPRVFRLPSQAAVINRYGLNSDGAETVAETLQARLDVFAAKHNLSDQDVLDGKAGVPPGSLRDGCLLAVQVAKNKATSQDNIEAVCGDYVSAVSSLGRYADVVVVNVSSPNTVGLRALQDVGPLTAVLQSVVKAAKSVDRSVPPAVFVKVSPDETAAEQIEGVCDAVYRAGVDGVIVANTTTTRPQHPDLPLTPADQRTLDQETGGYSGPLMFPTTLSLVSTYRSTLDQTPRRLAAARETDDESSEGPTSASPFEGVGPKTIFASGGISTGEDVIKVLDAGASVGMMYTALTMHGLGRLTGAKKEMRDIIASQRVGNDTTD